MHRPVQGAGSWELEVGRWEVEVRILQETTTGHNS
jgi:hypothetical protein